MHCGGGQGDGKESRQRDTIGIPCCRTTTIRLRQGHCRSSWGATVQHRANSARNGPFQTTAAGPLQDDEQSQPNTTIYTIAFKHDYDYDKTTYRSSQQVTIRLKQSIAARSGIGEDDLSIEITCGSVAVVARVEVPAGQAVIPPPAAALRMATRGGTGEPAELYHQHLRREDDQDNAVGAEAPRRPPRFSMTPVSAATGSAQSSSDELSITLERPAAS